jgi:hypothetical protein
MVRPHWNNALDGPQPVCPLDDAVADPEGVVRVGVDYLP